MFFVSKCNTIDIHSKVDSTKKARLNIGAFSHAKTSIWTLCFRFWISSTTKDKPKKNYSNSMFCWINHLDLCWKMKWKQRAKYKFLFNSQAYGKHFLRLKIKTKFSLWWNASTLIHTFQRSWTRKIFSICYSARGKIFYPTNHYNIENSFEKRKTRSEKTESNFESLFAIYSFRMVIF